MNEITTAIDAYANMVRERARQSAGISDETIYRMVDRVLDGRHESGGTLADVGCGSGQLWPFVRKRFVSYIGVDVIRYEEFPAEAEFHLADLNSGQLPLPDSSADVVASLETIEHLENPRAFTRELVRVAKPGSWVVISTPNQLSLLSLITLLAKHQFNAFQDVHYPAHLTALLEVDLRRMASECGLADVYVGYSLQGRLPLTPWHYPKSLARIFPRALSDNLLLLGRKTV